MTVDEAIIELTILKDRGFGDLPIFSASGITIEKFKPSGIAEEGQDFIPTSVIFTRTFFKALKDRHN